MGMIRRLEEEEGTLELQPRRALNSQLADASGKQGSEHRDYHTGLCLGEGIQCP